jgi:hypothetical protein
LLGSIAGLDLNLNLNLFFGSNLNLNLDLFLSLNLNLSLSPNLNLNPSLFLLRLLPPRQSPVRSPMGELWFLHAVMPQVVAPEFCVPVSDF